MPELALSERDKQDIRKLMYEIRYYMFNEGYKRKFMYIALKKDGVFDYYFHSDSIRADNAVTLIMFARRKENRIEISPKSFLSKPVYEIVKEELDKRPLEDIPFKSKNG